MRALSKGANPNALHSQTGHILSFIALAGHPILLKMLLDWGGDPQGTATEGNGKVHPLIYWAFDKKKPDHMQLLLDAGANPNPINGYGYPLANPAIESENEEFLRMMLAKGLDPNTTLTDREGKAYPLLYWAINKNKPAHAQLLLDAGANPNVCYGDGTPIVLNAFCSENPLFLKMILATKKLDPNTTIHDNTGKTAHPLLYWAINQNKSNYAQLLLNAGANPNALDGFGQPIAFYTIVSESPVFLMMMLAKGLNPNAICKDDQGNEYSLLSQAQALEKAVHTQLLIKAGAK